MAFDCHAKNYFITYPRCPIPKEQTIVLLKSIHFPIPFSYIRISEESHEDGAKHLHCLIQFSGKFRCTNNKFFDIKDDVSGISYHPNIQGARSAADVYEYITKGGVFIEDGEFKDDGRKRHRTGGYIDDVCKRPQCQNKGDALSIIRKERPRTYVLQFHKISAKLDKIYAEPIPMYVSHFDRNSFKVPDILSNWALTNVKDPDTRPLRPISLIIEGPTRIGKTEWARSLGNHNFICGFIDLNSSCFSNDAWYNIIDNISPHYLAKKHWKELIGSKRDWQSKIKYGRKPVQIKGGIPSIVLCNPGNSDSSYKCFLDKAANSDLKSWTLSHAEFFFTESLFYSIETSAEQETS